MGKAKLRLKRIELPRFDKGFFPNKDFEDVPDGGSADCKHVYWHRSGLRPFPGMDRINSAQAATTRGNGLFYLDVNGVQKRAAVFGAGFYEDVSGTWTARTGAVTITDGANNHVQFIAHQQGSNKYLIGVNGVNAPFKWTGSGNAAVLGGSPPANFTSIAKYHDIIWGSYAESVYFSEISDPETWDATNWVIPFDKDVVRVIDNGQKLAVLMGDHIGSIRGFSYLDVEAEETEIARIGCVGRLAATNAVWQRNNHVIATLSRDGLYLIDKAFGFEKIFGDNYIDDFNIANLHKSVLAFDSTENLLFCALPYDTATENDYLIIVDMTSGAIWPGSSIHTNNIRAMASMKDDNGNEFIYFIDANGYAFKFNRDTTDYHSGSAAESISTRFKTKKFDMKDVHDIRDIEMMADADGDHAVTVSLNVGLASDDGSAGSIDLLDDGDLLGSTFILGASTLGGSDYIFKGLENIGDFGRFFQLTFEMNQLGKSFNIRKVEILAKRRRMGTIDK